jgi:riboflavin biosynthesis pyrimidine reductase
VSPDGPVLMRRLYPGPGDVDPEQAYAVPADRPWLRANMVATVDGAVTAADGRSAGVSGPADKRVFGLLRRLADVVMVGAGTARAEGYRPARLPIALVTGRLDLDLESPLLAAAEHRTIVLTAASAGAERLAAAARVADVVVCGDQHVDLTVAVRELRARGLRHVLCEGGPRLLGSVTAAGLLDELCLTVSPLLVGGADAATGGTAGSGGRILAGPALPAAGQLELAHLLEEDGALFARYLVVHR